MPVRNQFKNSILLNRSNITQVPSLGQEDPLQKEMAAHSSILAWRIPWTEEPDGYSPWGCEEPDTSECLTQKQNRWYRKLS